MSLVATGSDDAPDDLAPDAIGEGWRQLLEFGPEQVSRRRQRHRRLGGEQVHALKVLTLEDVAGGARGVGRQAPGRLLGDRPQPVGDFVEEAPLVLEALGEDASS